MFTNASLQSRECEKNGPAWAEPRSMRIEFEFYAVDRALSAALFLITKVEPFA